MGISAQEFLRLSPLQFESVYEQWSLKQLYQQRDAWERTRFMGYCCVLPHVKKGFKPTDLMQFDWDAKPPRTTTRDDFERMINRFEDN